MYIKTRIQKKKAQHVKNWYKKFTAKELRIVSSFICKITEQKSILNLSINVKLLHIILEFSPRKISTDENFTTKTTTKAKIKF